MVFLYINITSQFPIRGSYILDFAIPKLKIGIECDGEVWHDKRKDKIRDYWLKKKGWIILRFKGQEIKEEINNCINKIKEVINDKSKSQSNWNCTIINE